MQAIKRNDVLEGNVDQLMTAQMSDNPQHEANIYYVGKAGKLGIDFNGTWVWKKATRNQASYEKSQQLGNCDVHTFNVNRNNLLAGKLVLSYPVWKGELSVGSEISRSNNHGVYTNMEQVLLPSDDEIKESNTAAFAEYQLNLGEWSLGGGLRYESVNSDYYSFGNFQTEPSRKYRDWFPNITLGWEKNKWGIQLGYDKRISRPSYRSLNSNVQYDNRYQYEGGNPLLRPTIKQNLSLNVTYSWLSFIAGYRRDKDVQQSFGSLYKEGTEITIWTDRNFDKAEFYNLSLTASPKFGFYSPTLTVSYWQQNFDTKAHGIDRKLNKPEWEFYFRNWFTLNKTTKAMLYLHYTTSYYNGFTYYNHGFKVNARIQKKFSCFFVTNASLIDDDIIYKLKYLKPHLQITLDGDKEHHDKIRIWKDGNKPTFEHILWVIHRLSEEIEGENFFITLRINYDNSTLSGIPEILEKIKDIDRKKIYVHFERVWQTEGEATEQDIRLFKEILKSFIKEGFCVNQGTFRGFAYSCPADIYNSIVINYDGSIHKCNGRTLSSRTKYGVLKDDGSLDIDEDLMAKRLSVSTFENKTCLNCKMLPVCMGPCSQKLLENGGKWTK